MIPQLDPEILFMIAQHVKCPIPNMQSTPPSVDKAIKLDTYSLASLISVSRVRLLTSILYVKLMMFQTTDRVCAPLCYKDIVTNDFGTIASGLETNINIEKTSRTCHQSLKE
jgi:hypothetical protein